jgi:hypothetical protein
LLAQSLERDPRRRSESPFRSAVLH